MKKGASALMTTAAVCAALGLIVCSAEAMEGARRSLALCYEVLVPSLFPFFVISALLQELGIPSRLGRLAAPAMSRLFGVSGSGCASLILGFMAGYPLGAASVAGLVQRGELSKADGETGLEVSAARALMVGFFELGSGVGAMRGLAATPVNLAVCAAVIGWGGLSVHFQTSAVAGNMNTARHFIGRCLSAVFSFILVLGLAPAVL